MDPFSLWLLGGVVLPDAYQRVINNLGGKSAEHVLAKRIRADVGAFPKRVFRRWYRTQETWGALVNGGQGSFDFLVERLVAISGDRLFRSRLPRDRAEAIVRAAVTGFMGSLDASDAVNIADYRSAQRDRLIDENAEMRTGELRELIDERLDNVEGRLDGAADFDRQVGALPAPTRPFFEAVGVTRESLLLLDVAAAEEPREALVQLTADIPPWLRDASAAALVAAAELCRSYRVHVGAGRLFELAADRSTDRGYCYARAAVELATAGEADRSNKLVECATSLSASTAVTAIASALADDPRSVLEVLPADDALKEPFLVSVHLYGLRATSAFEEVIPFLTAALERYPESSGLMIELARAYLQRSQEANTTSRTDDRNKALQLGLNARKLRRDWRADAAEAARVACQAALHLDAYDRVILIGMPPPDGEARTSEAADVEVRLSVAQAAIARGDLDLLRTVVDLVPEGFHRALIQADVLAHTDADPTALAEAYDAVWAEATAEEHRVIYWLSAAAAGVDLLGAQELGARTDDVPLLVDARLHLAHGEYDAAITLLRQHRRTEHTTRLLVDALLGTGDIDGAVDELKTAATRFNDTLYLVRAVEVLGRADRMDDAAALAKEALQRVPQSLTEARAFLHEVLVERAGVAEEWGQMAVRSRAWIEDLGRSPRNRWHFAMALYQSSDRPSSWRVLQEPPALQPTTASQARLWTVLAANEAPNPDVADRIIELVDAFPDDDGLAEGAVGLFFGRGDGVWGDVRTDTIARYQELLTTHAIDFGSNNDAAIQVITGTAEQMLERLEPSLEARARAIEEMSEKVRQGWPYGMLAAASGGLYTGALLHRAAGCFPIAAADVARADQEAAVARTSLGGPAVVDISTLVISGCLRQLWPQLRGAFSRLELPGPAQQDILAAVEEFRRPSDGTLYFDTSIQAVRGSDADHTTHERLLDHSEWVAAQVTDLVVSDWPQLVTLSDELNGRFLPWLSTLDMAKARGLPLWCDDLGLRTLAASDGVPTFGTTALMASLVDEGKINPGAARGAFRQLRQEYAVDLPPDNDWLRLSAASEEWRPGPAAFHFSRPAAWSNFESAYALWSELAQQAVATQTVRVAGWVHAAAYGISGTIPADNAVTIMAGIAVKGIALAAFDGEAIGACAARVREVALAAGIPNPVPSLMATLLRHLSDAIGPDAAARLMMSADLADPDRAVVRDLVFGLRSDPSPFDN